MTPDQHALYELMGEISEDCYCAGWMHDNEFALWRMVIAPAASREYGMDEVTVAEVAKLRNFSEALGGWIYWHDDSVDQSCPLEDWGPRFIAMPEWLTMFERYEARCRR